MIKEYFTDGLIGLAILLSLFRTDLDIVNINNLFSYPEVQNIIQGQTAAYLPAHFHHVRSTSPAYGNAKYIDFDNEVLSSLYNNLDTTTISTLTSLRGVRRNDIEAFLVSSSTIVGPHLQDVAPSESVTIENDGPSLPLSSSPTLPQEGANSFPVIDVPTNTNTSVSLPVANQTNDSSNSRDENPVVVDVSFLFNNPFPGCNLTSEDLELIDILWRQDEDLGVGKEVYDTNLRLELERKQELEERRLQELQKAQLQAKEKEEREKQEQADKWLKENFRRDGETGEWICCNSSLNPYLPQHDSGVDEFASLASDLDDLFNASAELIAAQGNVLDEQQNQTNLVSSGASSSYAQYIPMQPDQQSSPLQSSSASSVQQQAAVPLLQHQDSLDVDDWSGLEEYLNLNTSPVVDQTLASSSSSGILNSTSDNSPDFFLVDENVNSNHSMAVNIVNVSDSSNTFMTNSSEVVSDNTSSSVSVFNPIANELNSSVDFANSEYLLNNVSMPADGLNMTAELMSLTSASDMAISAECNMSDTQTQLSPLEHLRDGAVNFDLDQLGFFGELSDVQAVDASVTDLGVAEIDEMLRTIQSSGTSILEPILGIDENMDVLQRLGEEMNQSMASVGSPSSHEDFDAFEVLEGAIGGLNGNNFTSLNNGSRPGRQKFQRLSESSNDSGYAHKGSFSSSNSSNGSCYSGSPSGSAHGLADSGSSKNNHTYVNNFQNHQGETGSNSSESDRAVVVLNGNNTAGNGTEHDPDRAYTEMIYQKVAHNHTYNTPPGQVPREVKKYAHKEPSKKGPHSRDQRKADELKVPFTMDEIIESPVETFNEMISSHKLNEAQLNLIKDIRRRGKNKVAAQNCRKRKVTAIESLSDERVDLESARERLLAERAEMEAETRRMRAKFGQLYAHIFSSLRDEHGQPYDPSQYSLQQLSDGNVFLVPKNSSASNNNTIPGGATSSVAPSGIGNMPTLIVAGGHSDAGGSMGASSAGSSTSSSPSARSGSAMSSSKAGISASKKRKAYDE